MSSCLLALSSLGGRDGVGRTRAGVDGAIPGKDGQRSERSRRGGRERYSDPENELVAGANLDQFSSCAAAATGRRDEREYAKRKTHERGREGKIDLCCLHRPPRSLPSSDESRISLAGGRERRTFTE